jgi:anti-sigma factor RsiW
MDNPTPITPELRENLVAYLDGELDEVATLEVERTLSESAEIRLEVEELSRTWDLLEALPRVEASREFTERTIASIETSDSPEITQPLLSPNTRRQLVITSLVALAVLCAVGAFLLTNRAIPQRSDSLVRDLPVIEHLDLYEDVGDVRFLKELEQSGTLTESPVSELPNVEN